MCNKLIGEDHELAAQIAYDEEVAYHKLEAEKKFEREYQNEPYTKPNPPFNGITKQDKEKNRQLHKQVEVLQKKLQKQIDIDCGRTNLPSYKKEVKSILTFDKESLKELLREHLTIRVEVNKECGSYDSSDYVNVAVSIEFDEEVISCDNSGFYL